MSRKKPVFVKRKAHGFHSMPQIQNSSNNEIDVDLMKDLKFLFFISFIFFLL